MVGGRQIKVKAEFLYGLLKPMSKIVFYNKFNIKEEDYKLPEDGKAFIVVGHHVSAFDPIILNIFSKRLIRFLYADANEGLSIRNKFLVGLGMIPFSKNSADFKSIRILKDRLGHNQSVGIYPEGGASWDGKTDDLIVATSKLIKMMNVPVYGIRYNGAYLSKPRWGKNTRRGRVIMNTYPIFSQEEIKKLKHNEIHQRLTQVLSYNEYEWQAKEMIKFKGKDLAEYIERLLYKCPHCDQYNTFKSKGDSFKCQHCGLDLHYNEYGFIDYLEDNVYKPYHYNLGQWNKWQSDDLYYYIYHDLNQLKSLLRIKDTLALEHVLLEIDGVKQEQLLFGIDHMVVNGYKIEFTAVSSQSITFGSVVEFFYDGHKYHLEFLPEANISVKLFYDCLEIVKGGQHDSELG